jgi:hypothetical protein
MNSNDRYSCQNIYHLRVFSMYSSLQRLQARIWHCRHSKMNQIWSISRLRGGQIAIDFCIGRSWKMLARLLLWSGWRTSRDRACQRWACSMACRACVRRWAIGWSSRWGYAKLIQFSHNWTVYRKEILRLCDCVVIIGFALQKRCPTPTHYTVR